MKSWLKLFLEPRYHWRILGVDSLLLRWHYIKRSFNSTRSFVTISKLLVSILVIATALLLILYGYQHQWTGFSDYVTPSGDFQRAKTLWDWMQLLIIPLVLALGAFYLAHAERLSDKEQSRDQQRELALQTYLDKMTTLLTDFGLMKSRRGSKVRDIARARTLTTLRSLDGNRKGTIIRFLHETGLIGITNTIVELRDADLSEVNLSGQHLANVKLQGTHLDKAVLAHANLSKADLSNSTICNADLSDADLFATQMEYALLEGSDLFGAKLNAALLSRAILTQANLNFAKLEKAKIFRTDLSGAKLRRTRLIDAELNGSQLTKADLSSADLTGADLTDVNLEGANLTGATLINANFTGAVVSMKQLKRAKSLAGAKLPANLVEEKS